MTLDQFKEGWYRLVIAFDPRKSEKAMDDFMQEVFNVIGGTDNTVWVKAVDHLVKTHEHFPRIVHIRDSINTVKLDEQTTKSQMDRWERDGRYVPFDDQIRFYFKGLAQVLASRESVAVRKKKLDKLMADVKNFGKGNELGLEGIEF